MENETQVDTRDTQNTEEVVTETSETTEDNTGTDEAKAETKPKLSDEEQLAIHRRHVTKLEKKLGVHKEAPKEQPKEPSKSNEPDYARLAYLETRGINHPDDQSIVQSEAERLKLPLTDILSMEHIKSRLQANKDSRLAQQGLPKGGRRSGGTTQHDVDYWVEKGETPDDQELAEKVVEARMSKEKKNKFSDELFVG